MKKKNSLSYCWRLRLRDLLYWCWVLENLGVSGKYIPDEPYDIHLAKIKEIEELKQQYLRNLQAKNVFKNQLSKLHLQSVKKHNTKLRDQNAKLEPSTREVYCFTTNIFLAAAHNNVFNIHLPPAFPSSAIKQNQRKIAQTHEETYPKL